jgi:hypothetical protein
MAALLASVALHFNICFFLVSLRRFPPVSGVRCSAYRAQESNHLCAGIEIRIVLSWILFYPGAQSSENGGRFCVCVNFTSQIHMPFHLNPRVATAASPHGEYLEMQGFVPSRGLHACI